MWSGDRAVLTRVVELYESAGEPRQVEQVLEHFPIEQHDGAQQSLRRLGDTGYITVLTSKAMGRRGPRIVVITGVTEKGLRASGAWPDNAEVLADRILTVLAEGAENEPEPEKRSKLKAGLQGVGGMTRDVLVDVVGAALAKSTGLG